MVDYLALAGCNKSRSAIVFLVAGNLYDSLIESGFIVSNEELPWQTIFKLIPEDCYQS